MPNCRGHPGSIGPPSRGLKYPRVEEGCQGRAERGAGECQDSKPDPKPRLTMMWSRAPGASMRDLRGML